VCSPIAKKRKDNGKQVNSTLEKLDRVLMCIDWEDMFPLAVVKKLVRGQSDHNLPILDIGDGHIKKKTREFHFDNSWLKNLEFFDMIKDIWEQPMNSMDPIDVFNIKLKHVKKHLKGWGANLFGNNKKRKLELKSELLTLENLEENMEISPDELSSRANIQTELFKMYEEEESFWFQRAHSKWLQEGDQNTSYFHRIANGRKKKNNVHSLEKDGVLIEVTKNLLQHATDYYKELFGPTPGNLFQL
jgi:hypothetical protein